MVLLATLVWCVGLGWLHLRGEIPVLDRAEAALSDIRISLAGPRAAVPQIVIVAIDDATLAEEGAGFPYPRARLAEVIRAIARSGAHALAMDVVLADAGDPAEDLSLAEALAAVPSVVAATGSFDDNFSAETTNAQGWPRPKVVLGPQGIFASAARTGLANIVTDAAGMPERIPLLFETPQGVTSSLALQAAALFKGEVPRFSEGDLRWEDFGVALDVGAHLPLRHLGREGSIETLSASKALTGEVDARLKDKLVWLGFTATAVGDRYRTAFGREIPGVEILAGASSQLLGSPVLVRNDNTRRVDVAMATLLALAGVWLVLTARLRTGLLQSIGLLVMWLLVGALAYGQGVWFAAAFPLAVVAVPLIGASVLSNRRRRDEISRLDRATRTLGLHQPQPLGERLIDDPEFLSRPRDYRAAVLFVDITGSTALARELGAERNRAFLAEFQSALGAVVNNHAGTVLNYMGDGAMAVFGLMDERGDDARYAAQSLAAALELVETLAPQLSHFGDLKNAFRVGVDLGEVTLSTLGDAAHRQITISGDTVNLASRLLEVAKEEHAAIVATVAVVDLGARGMRGPDRRLAADVRGQDGPVMLAVWNLG